MVKTFIRGAVLLSVCLQGSASAQVSPASRDAIGAFYNKTVSLIRAAKTKAEVVALLDATETKDWVSIDPLGRRSTLAESQRALEASLATPAEKRAIPDMSVVWMHEAGGKATVLMWTSLRASIKDEKGVLGEKDKIRVVTVGALCRDTLVQTPKGWRRSVHEKLFPDQTLSVDGKGRFFIPGMPPIPPLPQGAK